MDRTYVVLIFIYWNFIMIDIRYHRCRCMSKSKYCRHMYCTCVAKLIFAYHVDPPNKNHGGNSPAFDGKQKFSRFERCCTFFCFREWHCWMLLWKMHIDILDLLVASKGNVRSFFISDIPHSWGLPALPLKKPTKNPLVPRLSWRILRTLVWKSNIPCRIFRRCQVSKRFVWQKPPNLRGLHLLTSSPPQKKTLCREFDDNPRSLSGSFRLLETLSFDQTDPVSFHFFSAEAGQVVFDIIGSTYTVAFTLELVLRIWGYGCRDFFCKEDWAWSILDVFVVATSLSELVLIILAAVNQNEGESLSGITSLKAFRIIRALFFM